MKNTIRELEARGFGEAPENRLRPELNRSGGTLLGVVRGARWLARLVLAFTLTSFLMVDVTWARTQGEVAAASLPAGVHTPEPKNLSEALQGLKDKVQVRRAVVAKAVRERSGVVDQVLNTFGASRLGTENIGDVTAQLKQVRAMAVRQRDEFAKTGALLEAKHVPEIILQRQRDAVATFENGYRDLETRAAKLESAQSLIDQGKALDELNKQLQGEHFQRSQEPFDPNAPLPFGPAPKADKREPSRTMDPVSARQTPIERGAAKVESALSALGDALITPAEAAVTPPSAPGSADLAPTTEVVINDAIRAKAAELHNSPVEIYNWVRNNVEWVPTYGAIQTADMTLAAQRGNSFDISSLLIALLRAAGTPARYAYGTIELPVEKVQNWVGGAYNAGAAQEVLGQGGIPNAGLTAGGKVVSILMEQVWVEAYVAYEPGRGGKGGTADNWVPMDASYKQYDYTTGYDLATNVPFDAQGLLNDLQATATTNSTEGWVQNVDQSLIQQRFDAYRTQVETYINNTNPDATVGQVLGTRNTIVFEPQTLVSGLPYQLDSITARYSTIPDSLRHKYTITLAEKTPLAIATDAKVINVTMPLSRAANAAVALSFVPATQADEEIFADYVTSGGEFSKQIPGYLIHVRAQLTLDGEVIFEGGNFVLGEELSLGRNLVDPAYGIVSSTDVSIAAGEYLALGVDAGIISPILTEKIETSLQAAAAELESVHQQSSAGGTPVVGSQLSKHSLVGNTLHIGLSSYFLMNDTLDLLDGRKQGVISSRLPSYGSFGTVVSTSLIFGGIPVSISPSGYAMDIGKLMTIVVSKSQDPSQAVRYLLTTGPRKSAMEHFIPEQLLSQAEKPAISVSTVKLISMAAEQGQKIISISRENIGEIAALNLGSPAEQDIYAAVISGKTVLTHQSSIPFNGMMMDGYAIIDPVTGASAYKISGGSNGSDTTAPGAGKIIGEQWMAMGPASGTTAQDSVEYINIVLDYVDAILSDEHAAEVVKGVLQPLKIFSAAKVINKIFKSCEGNNAAIYGFLAAYAVFWAANVIAGLVGLLIGRNLASNPVALITAMAAYVAATVVFSKAWEQWLDNSLKVECTSRGYGTP